MTDKRIRIIVTGGHLSPAIAVIEEIRKTFPSWEILFAGRMHAMEDDTEPSEEYNTVKRLGLPFLPVTTGRLVREPSVRAARSLVRIPAGFLQSLRYLIAEKPDAILSFGGYVAVPVVIAGWMLGVPVVTHEQTRTAGLANRIIALFSRKILVSFGDMAQLFPERKTEVTGLPIRSAVFTPPVKPPFPIPANEKVLYVTGGTTGAESMNDLLFPVIPELVRTFTVVHQTGRRSYPRAVDVLSSLPEKGRKRYIPVEYVTQDAVSWILNHCVLVIGRSGANTVGEVEALGRRAVFIPLPWSAGDEQMKNAQELVQEGSAVIVDQRSATAETVLMAIRAEAAKSAPPGNKRFRQAASRIAEILASVVHGHAG